MHITGNEIKEIANNSNPNCPGHISSAVIWSRERNGQRWNGRQPVYGREEEEKARERERESERRWEAKPLYNFWYRCIISILAPGSLIDFHSAGCMAARYPGAIFNHLALDESQLHGVPKESSVFRSVDSRCKWFLLFFFQFNINNSVTRF